MSDAAAPAPVPTGDDVCLKIGANIAEIIISATTDAQQKAAYEQERAKLVKRFSDNCTREKWPEASRACFLAAKNPADVETCTRNLPRGDQPGGRDSPAGGSAAASAAGNAGGSATGSAATGSVAAGSAAGSAMKPDPGTPQLNPGSAAPRPGSAAPKAGGAAPKAGSAAPKPGNAR